MRLGADRGKGAAAAAPDRAAASVEQLHPDAEFVEDRAERARRLGQRPGGGQVTAILVRIRIADHHFLMAPRPDDRGDLRQCEIGAHDFGACLQILDRLEQRHRHDRGGGGLAGTVEAEFLQHQVDFEQVGHRLAHRDDIVGDALRAIFGVRIGGGLDDRQFGAGLVRILGIMAEQRPGIGQFAAEQRHARILVQCQVIRLDARDLQQLGDNAFMHRRILPQVERGEVEAERLDRADQPPERTAARQRPIALCREAAGDRDQIGA